MLILTEKPSVAKDFANALGCKFNSKDKCWKSPDNSIIITNCVGHLYELEEPAFYDLKFKSWKCLPIIPEHFEYRNNASLKSCASTVTRFLKAHRNKEILIATDADREGEIIARECLLKAGISDFSKIKRFWVSQALTPEVIKTGIAEARSLSDYNTLALQGFARQHSDWLVGMNVTRFITNKAGSVFPVGRVQTALLSAINKRCNLINNFKSEKYYEIEGEFKTSPDTVLKGKYISKDGKSKFTQDNLPDWVFSLDPVEIGEGKDNCIGLVINENPAKLENLNSTEEKELPPRLYNLNELQKDAFRYFGYSAEKTLSLVQKLYEVYKCVSYPRTPSKVMGSKNVNLCQDIYQKLCSCYTQFSLIDYKIEAEDKRHFDDSKLESHHAIIPLEKLSEEVGKEEKNVYNLILERFMLSFSSPCVYKKTEVMIDAEGKCFEIKGKEIVKAGWKTHRRITKNDSSENEDEQTFQNINLENLTFKGANLHVKYTRAPKHFNEATILAFMENPVSVQTQESDSAELIKLSGLGTPATQHTFIPKLLKSGYIVCKGKNIEITERGRKLLFLLESSPLKKLALVDETTRWEEHLSQSPIEFEKDIRRFIAGAILQ